MLYSANFIEMAGNIGHVNVAKYLRDLDWTEIKSKRDYVKIFQFSVDGNLFQADVPIDKGLRDYSGAMYRVVETISHSVRKSVEQVILELLNPLSDILRVRVKDSSVRSGSIFVEDAINLYENTKKLIMAAAFDILNPKPIHSGRPDSRIQGFISNCRFGQTEVGSYVVSVVCPFVDIDSGKIRQKSLFDDADGNADSLTRKVTNKVLSSIKVIKESIDDGAFSVREENCISSNFLEALIQMSIYKPDNELEITAKYAPTVKRNILEYDCVSITHDYLEPIKAEIEKIKNVKREEKIYIGRISKLQAATDLEKRDSGFATIVFIDEDEKKRFAKVELSKDDHELAIDAYREGKNVKVVGTISGRKNKEIACSEFEIIE